jgi:cobalamin biosynthetic protein CobC
MDQATSQAMVPPKRLEHGGRLELARRLFPGAPEPFIDLSTGVNPFSFPLAPFAPDDWKRLPEPEDLAALEAAALAAYGAKRDSGPQVAAAPGTQIVLALLPRLYPMRKAAILSPTYGEYAASCAAAGVAVREIGELDEIGDADLAVICNPNNPTGRRFRPDALLDRLQAYEGLVLIDEAFGDLEEPDLGAIPLLAGQDNCVVLRSFSKAYGLAGLRLSFAIGGDAVLAPLKQALGPWPVSGPAIRIGTQALSDNAWLEAAKTRLRGDAGRLDAVLARAGFSVIGGTMLFRLGSSPLAESHYRRLGEAGLLVRRFSAHPDWLRFGIPGDEDAWRRLERALL